MEEEIGRRDPTGNVLRQSTLRPSGGFKSSMSGRYSSRLSPSLRRLHSNRIYHREPKGGLWSFHWIRGNRLVLVLMLIALWAYIGFHVQSQWAHNNHNKSGFIVPKKSEAEIEDLIRISDISVDHAANFTIGDPMTLNVRRESGLKKFVVNLVRKGRHVSSRKNVPTKKKNKGMIIEHKLRSNTPVLSKVVVRENDEIPRRNMSYGSLIGPFGKISETILGWSPEKRMGTCDRKSDFARLVWSRKFVLVFPELSMTAAPLTMMQLATELLSCGGTVRVVAVSQKGGLMAELNRRGIKVLPDSGEFSYKTSMKADLVVVGSAASSSWIGQYLKRFAAGSSQILWWIMESRRESFDRSKNMLSQVKMLAFLSEKQSKQWLSWCEEDKIQLKAKPEIVPLSINDELAFVVGFNCSLNTPSFTAEKMHERKKLLRDAVRKEMGLSDDDMLVVSLNSINPEMGQMFLLESILLMTEKKLPKVDVRIGTLNMSEIVSEDDESPNRSIKLENYLRSNVTSTTGKKKKRNSRGKKKAKIQNTRRKLLVKSDNQKKLALKVLVGSVGSKNNKVTYIKEILRFLSQHTTLSKSLTWTPATSHVFAIYAAADVYITNSQVPGEAFERGIIEAMAFGLPVLGTNAGGTEEIVEDKVTGLLHSVGQEGIRPLALNLKFLHDNPSARERLGSSGRLKVEKMYLKRHMYKKLGKVFVQCMKIK